MTEFDTWSEVTGMDGNIYDAHFQTVEGKLTVQIYKTKQNGATRETTGDLVAELETK